MLHQLLDYFGDRSGVPALLNTSLNYFDEPIACTPGMRSKPFLRPDSICWSWKTSF